MSEDDDFGPIPTKPRDWDELFAITGNLRDIPIEAIERGRNDHEYTFSSKDLRPCGRKGCEKEHAHGWLVALPGRRYVHIGNDCAKKYANAATWKSNIRSYRDRLDAESKAEVLRKLQEDAQQKLDWLKDAKDVDQAIALHESFCREADGPILREILKRAERGNPRIERAVPLTEEEREARRVMLMATRRHDEPAPYVPAFETKHEGDIAGLQCFRSLQSPSDIRRSLRNLATMLVTWKPDEKDVHANRSLKEAVKELIPTSNRLNLVVAATHQFFSESNLRLLMKLGEVKGQGVVSIDRDETDKIRIVRRVGWK